jgi:type II secretory pathway pseudopilin PulG
MAEVVISAMLVGVVLVGALNGVGGVLKAWNISEQRHDGLALAQQLMAEVLQHPYEEPVDTPAFGVESPESAGVRYEWDDVDDYHGWTSTPEDKSGNPLAGYANWTRSVAVAFAQVSDPTQTAGSDEGLKRITVTVSDPTGQTTVLDAYRSKRGALEMALEEDATVQTLISNEIEIGGLTKVYGSTHMKNHVQDD